MRRASSLAFRRPIPCSCLLAQPVTARLSLPVAASSSRRQELQATGPGRRWTSTLPEHAEKIAPLSEGLRHASTSTSIQVTDPVELYRALVLQGKIKYDEAQMRALLQIAKLHEVLFDYRPPVTLLALLDSLDPASRANPGAYFPTPESRSGNPTDVELEEESQRREVLAMSEEATSTALVKALRDEEELEKLETPKGFLLTGAPGTGKSMVMDIFFETLPTSFKVRMHYHNFLLSVYDQIHAALDRKRRELDAEEAAMNAAAAKGEKNGYFGSRKDEQRAKALTKGWQSVFAGGRSPTDVGLNSRDFVLAQVARDLIKEHGYVLAFDEVQLVDIAGANLVKRVLEWYWRLVGFEVSPSWAPKELINRLQGGVVIGTSNRLPQDLYNSGVQRESLNSFLLALSARSPVVPVDSTIDYRRERSEVDFLEPRPAPESDLGTEAAWGHRGSSAQAYFVEGEEAAFAATIDSIVGQNAVGHPERLRVYGRDLLVPWSFKDTARFTFAELCEKPLGPADYITLASRYSTIILTSVPVLPLSAKNDARRLITLLDTLYETKTRLLIHAAAGIDDLFFPDALKPNSFVVHGPTISDGLSNDPPNDTFSRDNSAEYGDSLTEEMMGEVLADLEAPYRPNISTYEDGNAQYKGEPKAAPSRQFKPSPKKEEKPHPSASVPSFQSLAIFSGEDERFAFKRAVSRVHEMSGAAFLTGARWVPVPPFLRTWEQEKVAEHPKSKHTVDISAKGPADDIGADPAELLSGVLSPKDLRVKFPDGSPEFQQQSKTVGGQRRERFVKGEGFDPSSVTDPKRQVPEPVLSENHVWGVRDDWGPAAGQWGQGTRAADRKK